MYKTQFSTPKFAITYRQWNALESLLTGAHIQFIFTFGADQLNGEFKIPSNSFTDLSRLLKENFDNTTIIAKGDPHTSKFLTLEDSGALRILSLPAVSFMKFAEEAFNMARSLVINNPTLRVLSCEVVVNGSESFTFYH